MYEHAIDPLLIVDQLDFDKLITRYMKSKLKEINELCVGDNAKISETNSLFKTACEVWIKDEDKSNAVLWGLPLKTGQLIKPTITVSSAHHNKLTEMVKDLIHDTFTESLKDISCSKWEAILLLDEAAASGCPEAQYIIGMMYEKGLYLEENEDIALELYKKSAIGGCAKAEAALGGYYRDQDEDNAISWYQLAVDHGDRDAITPLADIYDEYSDDSEDSAKKAFLLYKQAAGCYEGILYSRAMYKLAFYYMNGIGCPKSINQAINYYKEIALSKTHKNDNSEYYSHYENYSLNSQLVLIAICLSDANQEHLSINSLEGIIESFNSSNNIDCLVQLAEDSEYTTIREAVENYVEEIIPELLPEKFQNIPAVIALIHKQIELSSQNKKLEKANKKLEKAENELKQTNEALKEKSKKLKSASKELHEKEKEMLSFFTHTMRNALATAPESLRQAIRLLGSEDYESNQKHYKAINKIAALFSTLSLTDCLIDTFKQSISEPKEFQRAWQNDNEGDATPKWVIASALRQSLNRIIFMSDTSELRQILNNTDTTAIVAMRKSFIDNILPLNLDNQGITAFYQWLSGITSLEITIEDHNLYFGVNQVKFSLLFAISSELILNALKYWNGSGKIQIRWYIEQEHFIFKVTNTCETNASSSLAGTHKGIAFIKRLLELLGEQAQFSCSVEEQLFIAELKLHQSLLEHNA